MFEITDEFLAQAGFGALPDAQKEQMRQQITEDVSGKITDKIIIAVGENRLDEFEALLDGDDVPALLIWCQNNEINLTEIVQSSMNETMAELQMLHNDAMQSLQQ